jgi:hypothetical protein
MRKFQVFYEGDGVNVGGATGDSQPVATEQSNGADNNTRGTDTNNNTGNHEYRVNEINAEIDKYNGTLAEGETPKEYVNLATTGVSLPDDFISLVSVVRAKDGYHLSPIPAVEKVHWNGYKIFADKLYCGVDVDLLYRAKIADVKFSDIQNGGTIDLPDIFLDSVVKITCMILNNTDTDILGEAVKGLMDNLVPNRRYSRIKQRMPFIV